ncbi:MAG: formylglycine-generating enzyme family protein [Rivularia sp. ALOHA_DT_140]|nr:formylglycine-generating enzyme family protein [Rivularia sp. ALOHA_DT_140]
MEIKPQLIRILAKIPSTQTVGERRALLSITGFDYLSARINTLEKSNNVFFSELIELVFSEGQTKLLTFLRGLVDSDFIGLEAGEKLNNLIAQIEVIKPQQWDSEFNQRNNNLHVETVSNSNQNSQSLKSKQNRKLIVPSIPGTQVFEFTTVTLNARGKEIESSPEVACSSTEELGNGDILEMVYIPEGEFWMGSPESEGRRYYDERPQHLVKIKPFFISKFPITQTQWREIANLPPVKRNLKLRPSPKGGKNHPVTQVSWFEAVEFCDRLSQKTGYKYRLPSEAEWEYACRGGTSTPFHTGETISFQTANYDSRYPYRREPKGTYLGKTTEVGSFEIANSFGLYDMHGLVWEWCLDNWHENYDNSHLAPENLDVKSTTTCKKS